MHAQALHYGNQTPLLSQILPPRTVGKGTAGVLPYSRLRYRSVICSDPLPASSDRGKRKQGGPFTEILHMCRD